MTARRTAALASLLSAAALAAGCQNEFPEIWRDRVDLLAASGGVACVTLGERGELRCWGRNRGGVLGRPLGEEERVVAEPIARLGGAPVRFVTALALDDDEACAISAPPAQAVSVLCWGGAPPEAAPTPHPAEDVTGRFVDATSAPVALSLRDGVLCVASVPERSEARERVEVRCAPALADAPPVIEGLTLRAGPDEVVRLAATATTACLRTDDGVACWGLGDGACDAACDCDLARACALESSELPDDLDAHGDALCASAVSGGQTSVWPVSDPGTVASGSGERRVFADPAAALEGCRPELDASAAEVACLSVDGALECSSSVASTLVASYVERLAEHEVAAAAAGEDFVCALVRMAAQDQVYCLGLAPSPSVGTPAVEARGVVIGRVAGVGAERNAIVFD